MEARCQKLNPFRCQSFETEIPYYSYTEHILLREAIYSKAGLAAFMESIEASYKRLKGEDAVWVHTDTATQGHAKSAAAALRKKLKLH